MDLFGHSGAEFSPDRKYRYALWRIWNEAKPKAMVIGLNPSTADESYDDPTIRRTKQLLNKWGFGGLYMLNVFAFITPYPDQLNDCDDPVGQNQSMIHEYGKRVEEVIFAWGANATHGFEKSILESFPKAKCIGKNMDGTPKHPLYVKRDVQLIPFAE